MHHHQSRLDYVIPIGLPDQAARKAIWERFVPAGSAGRVRLAALVRASDGFSPADIEFAARKASQAALERAVEEGADGAGDPAGPGEEDFLAAIAATRTTVSAETAAEFEQDIVQIARL